MGNFCEAFRVEKIEAPSAKRKCIIKWKGPARRPFRPKSVVKPSPPPAKPRPKGKAPKKSKKPIVCFKCGKPGHKSFQCKTEQKINELFAGDPELKQKLHTLLIRNHSEEEPDDYYSDSQSDSEYESSPIPTLNVITNKSQKEFLLDLISQIPDGDMKKEYLEKLKNLILEEEDKTPKFTLNASSSCLINIYKQFSIPNPYQQITTKDLQQEINQIKTEVRYLKQKFLILKQQI